MSDDLWVTGNAEVTWTYVGPDNSGRALYRPSGSIAATWEHTDCAIELSPAEHEIRLGGWRAARGLRGVAADLHGHGRLHVDRHADVELPGLTGRRLRGRPRRWMNAQGTLTNGGFDGMEDTADFKRTWAFSVP